MRTFYDTAVYFQSDYEFAQKFLQTSQCLATFALASTNYAWTMTNESNGVLLVGHPIFRFRFMMFIFVNLVARLFAEAFVSIVFNDSCDPAGWEKLIEGILFLRV